MLALCCAYDLDDAPDQAGGAFDIRLGGSLFEITKGFRESVALPGDEVRTFLEPGDEITSHGMCRRDGFAAISLGEA